MSDGGYIKLYRKIREHWVWQNAEYLKWWLDLLLLVNHQPKKIPVNGTLMLIDAGEYLTSETKLSERWFVNRKTVDKFLKMLEKDEMISVRKSRQNGTTIKVCNYQAYQVFLDSGMDNEKDNGGTTARTSKGQQKGHKQEPKEPEDIDMSYDISLAGCRQRYTPEQLKIIDEFFGVLKHTRVSAQIADTVILKIYQSWEKHAPQKVIYALHKYIHTPSLHDKKENYVLGIIRNASTADIEQYRSHLSDKAEDKPQSKQFKTAYERTLETARESLEEYKNGEWTRIDI